MSDKITEIENFGEEKEFEGVVDASADKFTAINIREQEDVNSKPVITVPNGTKVKVLEVSMAGWAKVEIEGGTTGYAIADYIKKV